MRVRQGGLYLTMKRALSVDNREDIHIAVVIPVYNHGGALDYVLDQLAPYNLPCLLVDDGSDESCQRVIESATKTRDWVTSIRLSNNQGKGAAVSAGLMKLELQGDVTHVMQIDADGQHNLDDIPAFLDAVEKNPDALILGQAKYDETVPKARLYGRYITHAWVWIETLSFSVKDTMCGFRVYPLTLTNEVIRSSALGQRMAFDTEVVVRLFWRDVHVINIPTLVHYPYDGVSHFSALTDNLYISAMHSRLFFRMLLSLPRLLVKRCLKGVGFVSGK